jgi:hypothetical protein
MDNTGSWVASTSRLNGPPSFSAGALLCWVLSFCSFLILPKVMSMSFDETKRILFIVSADDPFQSGLVILADGKVRRTPFCLCPNFTNFAFVVHAGPFSSRLDA